MDEAWQSLRAFLQRFLTGLEGVVLASLVAGGKAIAENGGALLIAAADAAVQAEETGGADGATKFSNAVAAVKGTLEDAGVKAAENAVRLAVEAGVARLRSNLS